MPSYNPLGILGAGRAGTAFARVAARNDIAVRIASSRTPSQIRYHLMEYAPAAKAVHAEHIAEDAAVIILAVPDEALDAIPPSWFRDQILIDAKIRWENEPLPDWFVDVLATELASY